MKERILTQWSLSRALFLILGIMVIVQSAMSHQWFGILFGAYFAAMGLFAFGCASGGCFGGSCATESKLKSDAAIEDVSFEEVKSE
jgi:hypothetical protein